MRDYLKGAGVSAPMEVRSMGEREPVTRDGQGTDRTPHLVACVQLHVFRSQGRSVRMDCRGECRLLPAQTRAASRKDPSARKASLCRSEISSGQHA